VSIDPGEAARGNGDAPPAHAALHGYAAHLLGDRVLADDVVQDVLQRWLQQPPDLRVRLADGQVRAWLFKTCRHRALDVRRKQRRMGRLPAPADTQPHPGPSPLDAAERKDTTDHVLQRLAQLPPDQQEVVRLRFQAGLTYLQIADATGHTVGNVGNLLHRALKRLREQFPDD
jgi:RNA polymerase sigma-70 factor (ECF subfamily)